MLSQNEVNDQAVKIFYEVINRLVGDNSSRLYINTSEAGGCELQYTNGASGFTAAKKFLEAASSSGFLKDAVIPVKEQDVIGNFVEVAEGTTIIADRVFTRIKFDTAPKLNELGNIYAAALRQDISQSLIPTQGEDIDDQDLKKISRSITTAIVAGLRDNPQPNIAKF